LGQATIFANETTILEIDGETIPLPFDGVNFQDEPAWKLRAPHL
jgi:hypothetical protein